MVKSKIDVYEIVTNKVLEAMETTGIAPWRKPWTADGIPRNLKSRKAYKGINQLMLACSPFTSPWWVSFNQAKEMGGTIKKGEKATLIVFWKIFDKKEDKEGKKGKGFLLRYFNAFNIEQCEGLKLPAYATAKVERTFSPIEEAERVLAAYKKGPEVREGKGAMADRACYIPSLDQISMPAKESFHTPEGYYNTRFHEEIHGTGHTSRLKREGVAEAHHFGDPIYSEEELVAEMGAAMLSGMTGITSTLDNSAAYIKGWAQKIKADPKLIMKASGQASKAVEFIIGEEKIEEVETEEAE